MDDSLEIWHQRQKNIEAYTTNKSFPLYFKLRLTSIGHSKHMPSS